MGCEKIAGDVAQALTIDHNFDRSFDNVHFHLTDQTNLTILANEDDLARHLAGEIEEAVYPLVAATTIERTKEGDFEVIVVDHPETETTVFRVRACPDPTCWNALKDYWL